MESVTLTKPDAPGLTSINSIEAGRGSKEQNGGVDVIPGERVDVVLAGKQILFLKVDVEGFEGGVLDAAQDSIKAGRVAHAVFEYTPKQFEHLPTDWVDFLPRLYRLGAKECYICHRLKGKIFRVSEAMLQQVHDALYKIRMQTDIFCTFNVGASVADKSFFKDAKDWTPQTSLLS